MAAQTDMVEEDGRQRDDITFFPKGETGTKRKSNWRLPPVFQLGKGRRSKKSPTGSVGTRQLFKYTDRLERVIMLVGTVFGLSQAGTQVAWLIAFFNVVEGLTEYGRNISSPNSTGPTDAMNEELKRYIINEGVVLFLVIGIANVAMVAICTLCWTYVADRHIRRIRSLTFRSIVRQEMGWFDSRGPGELTNRLSEDIYNIWSGTGDKVADIFLLSSRSLGGLVMAFVSGWKMAIVFLCFTPLVAGSLFTLVMVIKRFTQKVLDAYASAGNVAEEVLSGIRTVAAFSGHARESKRYAENLEDARKVGIKGAIMMGICQLFMNTFLYASFAVLVWYGPLLIRQDPIHYSPGDVMVVFFGVLVSTFSLGAIAPNMQSLAEAKASAGKIFEIIERQSLIDATNDKGLYPNIRGKIELRNICFRYPARPDDEIFNDFSLEIKPGETVALVGPSGCGKSTILQLIQRFYDPEKGQVLLDDIDVRDLNLGEVRSSMGIVSQEPVLFFGSVAENIELGKPGASKEEIITAAKTANAHNFIMQLPKGYDTVIGERGTMLSGGQKQRVAIARAVISDPKILLLDEATSALDSESERIVQAALDKAGENRTTVVVAHRLSTIKNADMIYVMERGSLVEQGVHADLMARKGLYYELVTAQATETAPATVQQAGAFHKSESEASSDEFESEDEEEEAQEQNWYSNYTPRISFSGVITPPEKPTTIRKMKKSIRRFWRKQKSNVKTMLEVFLFNLGELHYIVGGIICIVLNTAVMPIFAVLFTQLFEVFTQPVEQQITVTRKLSGAIFGIGVLGGLATLGSTFLLGKSGEELTYRMRSAAFRSMVSQDMSWFDAEENRVGALLARLSLDAAQLKGMTGQRIATIVQAIAFVVIGGALCFFYAWELTLAMICVMPLPLIAGLMQGQKMARTQPKKSTKQKKTMSYEEEAGKVASETINNIRTVVSMRREDFFAAKYERLFKMLYKQSIKEDITTSIATGVAQSVLFFMYAVAIGVGVVLVIENRIEFYNIFRVIALINMVGSGIGRGSAFAIDFKSARDSARNILSVIKRQPLIDSTTDDGIKAENMKYEIVFKEVTFTYSSRPNVVVLNNVSFHVPERESTAFVGPSGCGKSTIVSLMLRFYDTPIGMVLFGGQDVRLFNVKWLRSKIGFVQQEPVLFDLTIKENILYGLPEKEGNMEMVVEAAKMANIHDDISKLPAGYDTRVGSKGTHLSGGQKQRIAIARALIRNPKILLLDEATSALDVTSEKVVQSALDVAKQSRTTVTIAHRLSTIRECNKIVVFDLGSIVETGTHEELLAKEGLYAQLVEAQSMAT